MDSHNYHDVGHSTLEVQTAEHMALPQVSHTSDLEVVYPSHAPPPHATGPDDLDTNKLDHGGSEWQHGHSGYGYGALPQESQKGAVQETTRYCFGLSRKAFWLVVAAATVIVIGALAGGIAGGLLSRKSGDTTETTPPGSNSTSNDTAPLLGSQLAAVNWTDSTGVVRRAVFYQNDSSLLLRHTQGVGQSWTQVNISDQFAAATGSKILAVKTGTPLAAAAIPWQGLGDTSPSTSLFYLNNRNQVRDLVSSSDDLSSWTYGTSWSWTLDAAADSQLSAVPYYCPNCLNLTCVAYQDSDLDVVVTCDDNWEVPTALGRAYPGTPLSMIQFASDDGNNITNVDELRFFYYTNTEILDFYYNYNGNGKWASDPAPIIESLDTSSNGTIPQVVSSPSDFNAHILVVGMDGDGKFTNSWWNENQWKINQAVSFVNENGGITADAPQTALSSIAMSYNHYLYGVTVDGTKLLEYTWGTDSPYTFNWTSNVVSP